MSFLGSLASAVVGGLFGRSSSKSQAEAQRQANEQNLAINRENNALQREFATHGIQWKVEDAKAAGLHPLYALGGAGASFTPSSIPVMPVDSGGWKAEMGQNVARAATAFGMQELQSAQLEALKAGAAKDYALAAAAASEAARYSQSSSPPVAQSFPVDLPGVSSNKLTITGSHIEEGLPGNPSNLWPIKSPPSYLASNEGVPGFKIFNVPSVGEVILPNASSMSEALESLENPVLQAAVAAANAAHYGPSGARKLERVMGRSWSDPIGAGVDWARSKLPPGVLRRD